MEIGGSQFRRRPRLRHAFLPSGHWQQLSFAAYHRRNCRFDGRDRCHPYGGILQLRNVENVVGTDHADQLTGSNADNVFGDGLYDIGPDTIHALGGNDRVELAEGLFNNHGGVRADGGSGIDTLAVNLGVGQVAGPRKKLDLTNQANNTGVFKNDVLTNFEIREDGKGFFAASGRDPSPSSTPMTVTPSARSARSARSRSMAATIP